MNQNAIEARIAASIELFRDLERRGTHPAVTVQEGREVFRQWEQWLASGRDLVAEANGAGVAADAIQELSDKVRFVESWMPQIRELADDLAAVLHGRGVRLEQVLHAT